MKIVDLTVNLNDLIDVFLSKKQQGGFNTPSHVLKKNLNSNDNLHMRKRLTTVLIRPVTLYFRAL